MRKFLIVCISCFLSVACDREMSKKFMSKDVESSSVKTMMEPVEDEEFVENKPVQKVREPEFIIPEVLKQNVSLSINEKLPIKGVLYETAKQLNIDFQMDPNINTKLIFSAHNRPFIEVLDAVCDMANLRYSIRGNFVSVVSDTPYTITYDVQFLNFSRDSENKISIATEVSGVSSSGETANVSSTKGAAVNNSSSSDLGHGSNSSVTVKTKNDFWAELENGVKIILQDDEKGKGTYSVNRQSGVVTICANSKKQSNIKDYIMMIKRSTESQVLIEAKIIEVSLKNEFKRGIDWNILGVRGGITGGDNITNGIMATGTSGFTGAYKSGGMNAILKALEKFGSMRTISNPRITAMNNQAATLKVAKNHVYFKLNYDKTYTDNGHDGFSASSDLRTVPIGFVMFVQPSIDTTNNTITLFLRPTISKLSGTVNDPAVDMAINANSTGGKTTTNAVQSQIPVTEVKEVTSVLKLNDGEIAVLGGFMEARSGKQKSGIPLVGDIPVVGEITGSYELEDEIVELVILIKVKISDDTYASQRAADIRLQRFVPDPRPF